MSFACDARVFKCPTHRPASNPRPCASSSRTLIWYASAAATGSSADNPSTSKSVVSPRRPCQMSASASTASVHVFNSGGSRGASSTARHSASASTNAASEMRVAACQIRPSSARSSSRAVRACAMASSSVSNAAFVRPRSFRSLASVIFRRAACRQASRRASAAATSRSSRSAAAWRPEAANSCARDARETRWAICGDSRSTRSGR